MTVCFSSMTQGNEKIGINQFLGIQYLYVTLSAFHENFNSMAY